MRATLHQLKVFRQVALAMNYTKAGQELGLTQPAVSIQLKQLESNLDLPLFEKIGKKLYLTPAGLELNNFCDELFARFDSMDMTLSALKGNLEGDFHLAAVSSAKYFSPHLLGAFHKRYPKVNLHLDIVNREQMIQRLQENKDDLVIMGMIPESMALKRHPFVDNPIVIVASPNHPLAERKNIKLKELAEHAFIFREKGSGTRKALEDFLQAHQLSIQPNMILGSSETIKQAVMADLGISALSRHSLTLELATNCLVELNVEDFPLVRSWYLVHHESKHLSPIAQAFINFALSPQENVAAICNRFLERHFIEKDNS
ncbi:LysR family transcriptional regulator [Psychromonas ossibalaenae]|uniref:LysR family transcriptional regulator n=1 Tax=Psychromonas ossibalaenae TaxID=444922 RepID=UPI00035E2297|nr:LysR family transcriptional regulator [Psychromonas ossibalaenae]